MLSSRYIDIILRMGPAIGHLLPFFNIRDKGWRATADSIIGMILSISFFILPFEVNSSEYYFPDYIEKSYINLSLLGGVGIITGDSGAPFGPAPGFGLYLLGDIDASFSIEADFTFMKFPIDSSKDLYLPSLLIEEDFCEGSLSLYSITGGVRLSFDLHMSIYQKEPFFLPFLYIGFGAIFSDGELYIPSSSGDILIETFDSKFAMDLTPGFNLNIRPFFATGISLKMLWSPAIDRDEITGENIYRNIFILSPMLNIIFRF